MRFFTTVHLLLLAYIVSALVFWGFSLERQNLRIYQQERLSLKEHIDSVDSPEAFMAQLAVLNKKKDARTKQYLGEGVTFLFVILIGAAVVYTSFRRSIRLSRQQNNFMLSVTHELKSPIAAMKLNLQTLEKYQLDEEKRNKLLERCILESNRLNDLCNNMLIASQMEGHQYVAARENFDFSELAAYAVHDYMGRYPGRFDTKIDDEHMLTGDRLLLQMAINNLLENAIKYTPADTEIFVSVEKKGGDVCLMVADKGLGIADEEKKKIFNKFYRVGNENTRKTKGTGLGLYLTKKIVKEHNGRIAVKDNVPTGSIFEIVLPLG
ncbi:sensor histidine kinase [Chitinophagaceae bacterium MMS25-I14]